jgi:hypothetical protein
MKERKKRFVSQPDKKKPKQANKTKQNKTKRMVETTTDILKLT